MMIMINFNSKALQRIERDFDNTYKSRIVPFESWEMGGNSCLTKKCLSEISSQVQIQCLKTLNKTGCHLAQRL